ncbi:uncharacterized protein I303_102685 [Kwoniella dejecticola CBS 10117]|uniref:tRNA-splicing endonuclease subunit Sen34 n=1 Tax=Kwoniella dejecticola CBS 10117 TaxID=1296121 RepID=A0A1A6A9F6_9TREE|nr:tRNA-splicing endonuclease subunit Sen34 [Kwoniella dejecticola CBS 10117]OBR86689.1 tRNA-splicing endonuclease subunit Sen34 [Kwoniella dejecticola CBS 10117]
MADLPKNGESSTSIPNEGSIPLYLVNGVATVWDAQVAATLHCIHNVSGLRAGTLPGVSQQNGFLGLPMTLMREETAYLVQQGIAHLIYLPTFPSIPTPDEISRHTAKRIERVKRLEKEARQAEESKKEISAQLFEKGGEKARLKREARAKAKAEKEAKIRLEQGEEPFLVNNQTVVDENHKDRPQEQEQEQESSSSPLPPTSDPRSSQNSDADTGPSPGYFLPIPSHPPILSSPSSSNQQIITSIPHAAFNFPSTRRDKALVGVFTALQKRGYRMGLGPRFGGEYLVYPGDYLRYHAHFTSQVLVDDEPIKPAELVAWGRLGTGTKKAGLLCCWDERNYLKDEDNDQVGDEVKEDGDGVEFYSLEWANFG